MAGSPGAPASPSREFPGATTILVACSLELQEGSREFVDGHSRKARVGVTPLNVLLGVLACPAP